MRIVLPVIGILACMTFLVAVFELMNNPDEVYRWFHNNVGVVDSNDLDPGK